MREQRLSEREANPQPRPSLDYILIDDNSSDEDINEIQKLLKKIK